MLDSFSKGEEKNTKSRNVALQKDRENSMDGTSKQKKNYIFLNGNRKKKHLISKLRKRQLKIRERIMRKECLENLTFTGHNESKRDRRRYLSDDLVRMGSGNGDRALSKKGKSAKKWIRKMKKRK